MVKRYDLDHLIYIGEQYEVERKLSRWSLDGGLALAVLRDLAALQSEADRLREALEPFARAAECLDAYDPSFPDNAAILRASADCFMRVHEKHDAEAVSDLNKPLVAGDLRRARAALCDLQAVKSQAFMGCGHHISLLVKSVESDHTHCELCDIYSQRNDALTMERHYKFGLDATKAALQKIARMTGDRTASDQLGECRSIARAALSATQQDATQGE